MPSVDKLKKSAPSETGASTAQEKSLAWCLCELRSADALETMFWLGCTKTWDGRRLGSLLCKGFAIWTWDCLCSKGTCRRTQKSEMTSPQLRERSSAAVNQSNSTNTSSTHTWISGFGNVSSSEYSWTTQGQGQSSLATIRALRTSLEALGRWRLMGWVCITAVLFAAPCKTVRQALLACFGKLGSSLYLWGSGR